MPLLYVRVRIFVISINFSIPSLKYVFDFFDKKTHACSYRSKSWSQGTARMELVELVTYCPRPNTRGHLPDYPLVFSAKTFFPPSASRDPVFDGLRIEVHGHARGLPSRAQCGCLFLSRVHCITLASQPRGENTVRVAFLGCVPFLPPCLTIKYSTQYCVNKASFALGNFRTAFPRYASCACGLHNSHSCGVVCKLITARHKICT